MTIKTFFSSILLSFMLCISFQAMAAGEWDVNCKDNNCSLAQGVTDTATGQKIATLTFSISLGKDDAVVAIGVPLGVALEAGIKLKWNTIDTLAKFRTCYPDGCQGVVILKESDVDDIAKAPHLAVMFFPVNQSRPILAEIPMTGLTDALVLARSRLGK